MSVYLEQLSSVDPSILALDYKSPKIEINPNTKPPPTIKTAANTLPVTNQSMRSVGIYDPHVPSSSLGKLLWNNCGGVVVGGSCGGLIISF